MKKPISLMIAEDHKLMRVGLKTLFEEDGGFIVTAEAASGKEAVDKALIQKPDIVLMDIGFSDINGIKASKLILEKNPLQKIAILTSHTDVSEVTSALSLGIYAYIVKDINTEILKMVLKSVNNGAVWLDPHIVPAIREKGGTTLPVKKTGRAAFRSQHANLTEREYEVLKLVVDGKSNNDIANLLSISEHTAKAHVCSIIQKLVVDDRTQAAVKALKEGIV
ncbi:MAG: response regulator transcription factor [Candidatus Gastranaerophilales bacterium]|nr:response regulator transcription factor [Candidatus Gastranaerophilales bacterium]